MKSPKQILMLICLSTLLAGCTSPVDQSDPPTEPVLDDIATITDTVSEEVPEPTTPATEAPPIVDETESIRAVFVPYGYEMIPVAVFSNGQSLAIYHDGIYGYKNPGGTADIIATHREHLENDRIYAYKANSPHYWSNLSYHDFLQLTDDASDYMTPMYTNVPENFMAETIETHFSVYDQHLVPQKYKDHVQDYLQTSVDSELPPALIRIIWETDFDGDGKMDHLVASTNHMNIADPPKLSNSVHSAEEVTIYYMLTLFSETLGIHDIIAESIAIPLETSTASSDNKFFAFNMYLLEEQQYIRSYSIYDSGGDEYHSILYIRPVICDINGDGLFDICILKGSIYPDFLIYLQENHAFQKPLSIIFPA